VIEKFRKLGGNIVSVEEADAEEALHVG